ncbi:MAG: S-layer homology domain-containing protein [Bacillota bacterium]
MKRAGLILLVITVSLSLLIGPALAKGSFGNDRGKARSGVKAEKRIRTSVTNMTPERKQKLQSQLKEREKQAVKRQFSDDAEHWAKSKIEKVQSLGLIRGYEDGTFRPDQPVTMTEAMVMAVSLAENLAIEEETAQEGTAGEGAAEEGAAEEGAAEEGTAEEGTVEEGTVEEGTGEEETPDVPGWAREKAKKAMALRIVNVNRFHSEVQATRAQAAVMLAKALGLQPADTSGVTFSDSILISPEDLGYIIALKEAGVIKGTPDGKFNPNSAVTRAEIAAMLANMVDLVENDGAAGEEGTAGQETQPEENTGTTGETAESGTQPAEGDETTVQNDQGEAGEEATQPAEGTETAGQTAEGGVTQ